MRSGWFVLTAALVLASGCGPLPSVAPSPSATTFVVPRPTEQPITRNPLARASFAHPALAPELQSVFELVYRARTLPLGGHFDVDGLRGLVDGAYADYTLPLFDREVRDAQAGILQQVSFSGIVVSNVEEVLGFVACPPSCSAFASVTRTRVEVRAGAAPTRETATYKFALRRDLVGADGVSWVVYDFVNPATGGWISKPPPISDAQATAELKPFFAEFYAARSLSPENPLDLRRSANLVAGSYYHYTMPLLEQTRAEADSGALRDVRYADLSVKLMSWDPAATNHGGLAMVDVTRTSLVTRAGGPEPPQTATYRFRVHRHSDQNGPDWLAVDFLRPDLNRWVTDLAGATVIVPLAGHG